MHSNITTLNIQTHPCNHLPAISFEMHEHRVQSKFNFLCKVNLRKIAKDANHPRHVEIKDAMIILS